jgi:hypothetical protein
LLAIRKLVPFANRHFEVYIFKLCFYVWTEINDHLTFPQAAFLTLVFEGEMNGALRNLARTAALWNFSQKSIKAPSAATTALGVYLHYKLLMYESPTPRGPWFKRNGQGTFDPLSPQPPGFMIIQMGIETFIPHVLI